jgi:hypothetical protein
MIHLLHKLIAWYLRRCGGACHVYAYGPDGRYIVLMNERQYHRYTHLAQSAKPGEDLMSVAGIMRDARDEA